MRSTFFGPLVPFVEPRAASSSIRYDDLVTEALGSAQWRVCDGRLPEHDTHRLLGFIEVTKQLDFEVMSLVDGFEWFIYPTLAEATAHFAHAGAGVRIDEPIRPTFDAVLAPLVE